MMLSDQPIRLSPVGVEETTQITELLFRAYYDDEMFQQVFDVRDPLYELKLKELFAQNVAHFCRCGQPILGAFIENQLQGVVCINLPDSPLGATRFWNWRMKMLYSMGIISPERLLHKEEKVAAAMPKGHCHQLSLIAVDPKYQGKGVGRALLDGVIRLMREHPNSRGCGVLVSALPVVRWFMKNGYDLISKLEFANFSGELLFREK